MALLADDARDRATQLTAVTQRLTALVAAESDLIARRLPPLDGAEGEERARLANLYRQEMARIKDDPTLLDAAPAALLDQLRRETRKLQAAVSEHETALSALKQVSEGLVQAMAQEAARQRGASAQYGASGAVTAASGPAPALIDRTA